MNIHSLIPARSGSKRFKNKNKFKFLGQPLFLWSVNASIKSKLVNKTVVSTDDEQIINICKKKNINYIDRPKNISSDKSSSFSVLKHYYDSCHENDKPDYLVLLQPTSPLREKNLIDNCLNKILEKRKSDRLIELCELKLFYGFVKNGLWKSVFSEGTRGQDLTPIYIPSGRIYIYKVRSTILKNDPAGLRTITCYENFSDNINIDYKEDLIKLEKNYQKNLKKYSYLLF